MALARVWIDAVYISQDDLPERAQQVRIVKEIHKAALHVVVYLGEQTDGLDSAMGLLAQIASKMADLEYTESGFFGPRVNLTNHEYPADASRSGLVPIA
jgi:hypothetical protein